MSTVDVYYVCSTNNGNLLLACSWACSLSPCSILSRLSICGRLFVVGFSTF